jgi:hypothetical protein
MPIAIMVLVGCASGKLLMKINPSLEANALVYEVKSPDSWSDRKLNVSFGKYQVADVDTGWVTTKKSYESEMHWLGKLLGMNDPDSIRRKVSRSLEYKFKVGDDITWDAQCVFLAEEREVREKNVTKKETLSTNYTCKHKREDSESWYFSFEQQGLSQPNIKMTNNEKRFMAYATKGVYLTSDGRKYERLTPNNTGYTWTHDNNDVAAISIREEVPRVWLDKRNSDPMNDALSMASAGLLIYKWKIEPTIKNRTSF